MEKLRVGLTWRSSAVVTAADTAAALGSGTLPVFGTPAMLALMENAAAQAVQAYLPEGHTSVGVRLEAAHLAATSVGTEVWAEAELIAIDRRRLTFRVRAFDAAEKIGEGLHERFIVDEASFLAKAAQKQAG